MYNTLCNAHENPIKVKVPSMRSVLGFSAWALEEIVCPHKNSNVEDDLGGWEQEAGG